MLGKVRPKLAQNCHIKILTKVPPIHLLLPREIKFGKQVYHAKTQKTTSCHPLLRFFISFSHVLQNPIPPTYFFSIDLKFGMQRIRDFLVQKFL